MAVRVAGIEYPARWPQVCARTIPATLADKTTHYARGRASGPHRAFTGIRAGRTRHNAALSKAADQYDTQYDTT